MFKVLVVRPKLFCSILCRRKFKKDNPEYEDEWLKLYFNQPEKYVFNDGLGIPSNTNHIDD